MILAETIIANSGSSSVTGDIGLGTSSLTITGFNLFPATPTATDKYSTSPYVVSPGKVYATNYAAPTPDTLRTAISNMESAYSDAAGRTAPNVTDLDLGVIGGKTLVPGLYKWNGPVVITSDITLNGGPDAVWIFQASSISLNAGTSIRLTGGAKAKNIFWQAVAVTVGSMAHMEGIILSGSVIDLASGAIVNGRLLAQTSVTLSASTVTQPDATGTPPTADTTAPTVNSTVPTFTSMATDVAINSNITATFSEAMKAIDSASFMLMQGANTITSNVTYTNNVATLDPKGDLIAGVTYTVMLTAAITDLANNALAAKEWSFKTAASGPGPGTGTGTSPSPVPLGTAGNFAILAGTTITNVPDSTVTGDIGLGLIINVNGFKASSLITGFSLTLDSSGEFSTSAQQAVGYSVYATDYATPTPDNLAAAVTDMGSAYTNAARRTAPNVTDLDLGQIGGKTLVPGLYKWAGPVVISSNITLDGGFNDVWIFQASSISLLANTSIILGGLAQAKNIFWQTAGGVTVGANATMEGNILSESAIVLGNGATVNGRLLTPGAVTLDASTVSLP